MPHREDSLLLRCCDLPRDMDSTVHLKLWVDMFDDHARELEAKKEDKKIYKPKPKHMPRSVSEIPSGSSSTQQVTIQCLSIK